MNNQEELIETEYNRAVNLWNETYCLNEKLKSRKSKKICSERLV